MSITGFQCYICYRSSVAFRLFCRFCVFTCLDCFIHLATSLRHLISHILLLFSSFRPLGQYYLLPSVTSHTQYYLCHPLTPTHKITFCHLLPPTHNITFFHPFPPTHNIIFCHLLPPTHSITFCHLLPAAHNTLP
jgi:hypothetical protein